MDIWGILEINETTNIKLIKRAYANKTKEIHPEEQPEEFQQLYDAYHAAIAYAKLLSSPSESDVEKQYFKSDTIPFETIDEENLFANFDFEALRKHKKKAILDLNEVFNNPQWNIVKQWKQYIASESFQYIKNDQEFIEYLYYFLRLKRILRRDALALYKALGYSGHFELTKSENERKLYLLLKNYCKGPLYKLMLAKSICGISLLLLPMAALLSYFLILMITILHVVLFTILLSQANAEIKQYGLYRKKKYKNEVQVFMPFFFLVLFLQILVLWMY